MYNSKTNLNLLIYKQTSHTHAGSDTHTGQEDLLLLPPALAQAGNNLSGTSRAQRVAEGNGAAAGVHLGPVEAELVPAVDGHGAKGLVELDDVDVGEANVVLLEQLGDGDGRADTHDAGRQAGNGRADVLGEHGEAELDGHGALHEHHGGGTVGDLTGVSTSGDGSPLREGGADLHQALGSGAGSDTLVLGQGDGLGLAVGALDLGGDGNDLVVEPAGLLGLLGPPETLGGVGIDLLSGDAKVAGNVLARPAHGHHGVLGLLAGEDALVKGLLETVAAGSHGLGTNGDTNLDRAGRDGVGNVGGGLETGAAETVDRRGTGGVGESGREGCGAHLVGGLAVGDL